MLAGTVRSVQSCVVSLSNNPLCLCVSAARTRITKPPQDQSVIKGTKAIMTCGVTHDSSVTVR